MSSRLLRLLASSLFYRSGFRGRQDRLSESSKESRHRPLRGNGRRVFALFEDPLCPACKYFEAQLDSLTDYTVYIYTYPILGPRSVSTSTAVWCSADPFVPGERRSHSDRTPYRPFLSWKCWKDSRARPELWSPRHPDAHLRERHRHRWCIAGKESIRHARPRRERSARRTNRNYGVGISVRPSGPKLIEIPGGVATSTPQPRIPAVFLFANGNRIEAEDYMVTKDDLFITTTDTTTLSGEVLDQPGTKAANIERGIVITFPRTSSEFNLNF